jgi:hypothetical protein
LGSVATVGRSRDGGGVSIFPTDRTDRIIQTPPLTPPRKGRVQRGKPRPPLVPPLLASRWFLPCKARKPSGKRQQAVERKGGERLRIFQQTFRTEPQKTKRKDEKRENEKSLMSKCQVSKSRASRVFTLEARDFKLSRKMSKSPPCLPIPPSNPPRVKIPATCCRLSATKL